MSETAKLRIKIITRGRSGAYWTSQLPSSGSFTGQCRFVFDVLDPKYDWLVVIDDVSRHLMAPAYKMACADEHSLFVTCEPPTITRYGRKFTEQFAHVLTSQPACSLPHSHRIFSQAGNNWYNNHSYAELVGQEFPEKTKALSTVCSHKQQKHTIHHDRYQFTHWLASKLPSMDFFGHGSTFIQHKYEALDPYRYHLAIENYKGLHHWTEKLADPFLSGCFPFYYGCSNVGDYFPQESFAEIDIYKREEALDTIRCIIENPDHYASCREALYEARRLVMEDYNLLHMIEHFVIEKYDANRPISGRKLYGRKQMRSLHPLDALEHLKWRLFR